MALLDWIIDLFAGGSTAGGGGEDTRPCGVCGTDVTVNVENGEGWLETDIDGFDNDQAICDECYASRVPSDEGV